MCVSWRAWVGYQCFISLTNRLFHIDTVHLDMHRLWRSLIHCVRCVLCLCFVWSEWLLMHFNRLRWISQNQFLHFFAFNNSCKKTRACSSSNICVCVCMRMRTMVWMLKCVTWGFVLVAVQQSRVCSVPQEQANDACLQDMGETPTSIFIRPNKNLNISTSQLIAILPLRDQYNN